LYTQNFKQNALGSDQYLVKSGLSVGCLCMYEEISFGEKDFQISEQTRTLTSFELCALNIRSSTFQTHTCCLQYSHVQRADMLQEKP